MLFRILLLILLAAVLSNFADVFGNGYAGNVSFYIVYLVLFTMLMENFCNPGNSLTEYLASSLTELMRVLAPAYFIAQLLLRELPQLLFFMRLRCYLSGQFSGSLSIYFYREQRYVFY